MADEIGWLFTGLGGMRNLARSLMFHYGVDPDAHPKALTDLADVIGEELLSVACATLAEHGLGPEAVPPAVVCMHADQDGKDSHLAGETCPLAEPRDTDG